MLTVQMSQWPAFSHAVVDGVYYYSIFKRYIFWQIAKKTIDMPRIMTAVSIMFACMVIIAAHRYPKLAGAIFTASCWFWEYI